MISYHNNMEIKSVLLVVLVITSVIVALMNYIGNTQPDKLQSALLVQICISVRGCQAISAVTEDQFPERRHRPQAQERPPWGARIHLAQHHAV